MTTIPPGWQTDELAEEWVEEDHFYASGHSGSPLIGSYTMEAKQAINPSYTSNMTGTVIIHGHAARDGRTPLVRHPGVIDNNMFSPMKLEKIFKVPDSFRTTIGNDAASPRKAAPVSPHDCFEFDKRNTKEVFPFTFNQPVPPTPSPARDAGNTKLRLFQFEYDAYTREHLSALVDSIPVESSSKSTTPHQYSSRKPENGDSYSIRPTKRIKICLDEEEEDRIDLKRGRRKPAYALRSSKPPLGPVKITVPAIQHIARISPVAHRSNASSTINASESPRSLAMDELDVKLRQVALVSTETNENGHFFNSNPNKGMVHEVPLNRPPRESNQPRFPSSATTITHIGPSDICPLPDQVGRMKFDKSAMKWVKRVGEESDDPFQDVESVKDHGISTANELLSSNNGRTEDEKDLLNYSHNNDPEGSEEHQVNQIDILAEVKTQFMLPFARESPIPGTPLQTHSTSRLAPTPVRSALKGATPLQGRTTDAASSGKQRCVSFSDGRYTGRIKGLHPEESDENTGESYHTSIFKEGSSLKPSFRTKRIADILDGLEDDAQDEDPTPCRPSSQQQRPKEESLLGSIASNEPTNALNRSKRRDRSPHGRDATFLTECSFGVAHDHLLQCITDVQPFEPHWEELTSVDLSGKRLDSLARLKEFLPKIEELVIDNNNVGWLSGVPGGIRLLSAVSNQLTSLTSYAHLGQMQCLDISKNQVDSLRQLECLHRLRELKADYNEIADLDGLAKLTRLRKLSLIGNRLTSADLSETMWYELEYLDLSQNRLELVKGLDNLSMVSFVNLDENAISRFSLRRAMNELRCLRMSDNRLEGTLDVRHLINMRILYADRNRLHGLVHTDKLKRLETLSLRYQGGSGLVISAKDIRDVRRLYLSGNALNEWSLDEPCYNLIYLEMADCKLTRIPKQIGEVIPNVRVLNLNYNFVTELEGLEGLKLLRKVSMVGSRLRGAKSIVRILRGMKELEMVDFRMNPCTVSWYVPVLAQESQKGKADADSGERDEWAGLDAKFRRGLPDELYAGRLVYRGMLMEGCERLKMIDGLRVSEGERVKARELLAKVTAAPAITATIEGRRSKGTTAATTTMT